MALCDKSRNIGMNSRAENESAPRRTLVMLLTNARISAGSTVVVERWFFLPTPQFTGHLHALRFIKKTAYGRSMPA